MSKYDDARTLGARTKHLRLGEEDHGGNAVVVWEDVQDCGVLICTDCEFIDEDRGGTHVGLSIYRGEAEPGVQATICVVS